MLRFEQQAEKNAGSAELLKHLDVGPDIFQSKESHDLLALQCFLTALLDCKSVSNIAIAASL